MSVKAVKYFRIAVSLVCFLVLAAGFSGRLKEAGGAASGEFMPALLAVISGNAGLIGLILLLFWLLLAVIWGRVFCSFGCPLGFIQDIAWWIGRKVRLSKGAFRPRPAVRNAAVGLLVAMALFGGMCAAGWFEPFSLFGRTQLVQQQQLDQLGNETGWLPFSAPRPAVPWLVTVAGELLLAAVALTALFGGRVFCNTLCPAGGVLALVSRFSRWRLRLDGEKCVKCRRCVKSCKAGCIDLDKGRLDASSCVMCGNCLTECKFGAISTAAPLKPPATEPAVDAPSDPSRRRALISGAAGIAAGVACGSMIRHFSVSPQPEKLPMMPPGAGSREEFLSRCTGCLLCVSNCRGKTLTAAGLEYGWAGLGRPRLSTERGFCDFNCKNCSDICPTGALRKLSLPEKQRLQLGVVEYFRERCVVVTDETSCGACAEHCPTGALEMVDFGDTGLTIPRVRRELCIGCGACQYICPVRPVQAVVVNGAAVQRQTPDPAEYFGSSDRGTDNRGSGEDGFPF